MPKALLLGPLTPPFDEVTTLDRGVEIVREYGVLTPQALIRRLHLDPLIHAIICPLGQQVTHEVFEQCPQLRVISNIAVGLDNIDLKAAHAHQVRVSHTPHVLTDATADLAWSLLLSVSRRLIEADRLARSGEWAGWEMNQLLGYGVGSSDRRHQKTLGVIGLGSIGQAIAQRASGFNMKVCYHNRTRRATLERDQGWIYLELNDLLESADFVVLALALCPETYHIINKERLSLMKKTAILVNIGRGPLIDEEALIDRLVTGQLGGAALDVFEREPIIPKGLRALSNVVLSPHIGSATIEARQEMSRLAIESTVSVLLNHEKPRGYFAI